MGTDYKQIQFGAGDTIDKALQYLSRFKERGELVYGTFNGQNIYSDIDDLDSAYKKITGRNKSEFDADRKAENDQYKEQQRKHKESIPELTKEWIEKGNAILNEKYHKRWAEIVPIRLNDLYQGMELGATIEIVKELNSGCDVQKAKEIIDEQGHSGMSFSLVCLMVKEFSDRGEEFVKYVR